MRGPLDHGRGEVLHCVAQVLSVRVETSRHPLHETKLLTELYSAWRQYHNKLSGAEPQLTQHQPITRYTQCKEVQVYVHCILLTDEFKRS